MNQFEKYKLVWKIWTSFKKFELEVNLNDNKYKLAWRRLYFDTDLFTFLI